MDAQDLKNRTKRFALRVIRLVQYLPKGQVAAVIGRQLLRAGTSVGSNYRAACRAKSAADFVSKIGIVEEEADESLYWMELLIEARIVCEKQLGPLMNEASELVAIAVASQNTAKRKMPVRKSAIRNPHSAIES